MNEMFINIEKEYHVRWYTRFSLRLITEKFETLQDAESKYLELLNTSNISYVELLECKPIKAHKREIK